MGLSLTTQPAAAPPPSAAIPVGGAAAAPAAPGLAPSPLLAFFLGFLPGLGAFYNEQFGKGIIHLAIFLFLFIIGVDGAVSGGGGGGFLVFFSPVRGFISLGGYRTAAARVWGGRFN